MPLGFRISVKGKDLLDDLQALAQKAPELLIPATAQVAQYVQQQIISDLRAEPGPPRYPIRWKSERQRRYVMAKLRRENNLPYRRTHALSRAWTVEISLRRDGTVLTVRNPSDVAQFVYGPHQQPFHEDTGWQTLRRNPRDRDYMRQYDRQITDLMTREYYAVLNQYFKKRRQ